MCQSFKAGLNGNLTETLPALNFNFSTSLKRPPDYQKKHVQGLSGIKSLKSNIAKKNKRSLKKVKKV